MWWMWLSGAGRGWGWWERYVSVAYGCAHRIASAIAADFCGVGTPARGRMSTRREPHLIPQTHACPTVRSRRARPKQAEGLSTEASPSLSTFCRGLVQVSLEFTQKSRKWAIAMRRVRGAKPISGALRIPPRFHSGPSTWGGVRGRRFACGCVLAAVCAWTQGGVPAWIGRLRRRCAGSSVRCLRQSACAAVHNVASLVAIPVDCGVRPCPLSHRLHVLPCASVLQAISAASPTAAATRACFAPLTPPRPRRAGGWSAMRRARGRTSSDWRVVSRRGRAR